ncbi:hypothetical protein JVT61DRAFT_798 [Boletus reticuloceps]|uniref:Cytochrome P450 n=1 Tax=Boletus reticuloceps TaxID=495285 RepID=A0A8I2Z3C1_9AGAM|nr:hypothetical protein JVT61DRAFT_798 [Boletus reticuloceps]
MIESSAVVGLAALILVYALFKRPTRPSLSMIRGPPSPSFVFGRVLFHAWPPSTYLRHCTGNLLELLQRPVGEAEFSWQSQYGNVVRFKSVFGEDRLLIADPKALRKIMNISTDSYPKLPNYRVLGRMITGKGIIWADGTSFPFSYLSLE